MSAPSQRFHRCPSCTTVLLVDAFRPAPSPERPRDAVGPWSRCPECQGIAPRHAFHRVDSPSEDTVPAG